MSSPKQVSSSTVKSWMERSDSLAVVDVRDGDYLGGHIRNGVHVPSSSFYGSLPKLVPALAGKKRVVFHCMLSQVRGPSCAAAYQQMLASKGLRGSQEVYVLSGGFSEWARHYGPDSRYTEGFRAELHR